MSKSLINRKKKNQLIKIKIKKIRKKLKKSINKKKDKKQKDEVVATTPETKKKPDNKKGLKK